MRAIGLLLNAIYLLLIVIGLPWFAWSAWRKDKYREGYAEKLLGRVPKRASGRPCMWLHAVSVGEVNLLNPLLRAIALRRPECECVISTTTHAGMKLARKKYPEYTIFYCPLDFTWAVAEAMRRVRPDVLALAELELWPNLIHAARRRGACAAVVNGRLSEHSFRGYRRIRFLLRRVFEQIDLMAVQDATYAERFLALGAQPKTVQVTGSMKYDGAQTDRNNPATRRLAELAGFTPDDVVFLAGSTQEGEEAAALEAFSQLVTQFSRLRLVLVPRHPERFDTVERMLDQSGVAWVRRSRLPVAAGGGGETPSARVLLVDTVGELGAWWGTADIAFVGGSLGSRGGQNMIEPAAYGAAVSFGPNTRNFRDIVSSLLACDAAAVVANHDELTAFVRRCLEDRDWAEQLGRRAQEHVRRQLGATERTVELLVRLPSLGVPCP